MNISNAPERGEVSDCTSKTAERFGLPPIADFRQRSHRSVEYFSKKTQNGQINGISVSAVTPTRTASGKPHFR